MELLNIIHIYTCTNNPKRGKKKKIIGEGIELRRKNRKKLNGASNPTMLIIKHFFQVKVLSWTFLLKQDQLYTVHKSYTLKIKKQIS